MAKLIIKTEHGEEEYTEVSPNTTYDFDGIGGRYFYQPSAHPLLPWIALLEDGTLLTLFNGTHYPYKAEYELIRG